MHTPQCKNDNSFEFFSYIQPFHTHTPHSKQENRENETKTRDTFARAFKDDDTKHYIHLNRPRLVNGDRLGRLPARRAEFLNCPDNVHALNDFSKHNVFPIEPTSDDLRNPSEPCI